MKQRRGSYRNKVLRHRVKSNNTTENLKQKKIISLSPRPIDKTADEKATITAEKMIIVYGFTEI